MGRTRRIGSPALRRPLLGLALAGLALAFGAATANAAVTPGDFCVVGNGSANDATTDGWLATITRGGTITAITLTTALQNPWDCAIDPTNGDVIILDAGDAGAGTDGALHRITVTAGVAVTETTLHTGSPLVNPRGVAVGNDGTIYLTDLGASLNAGSTDGALYAYPPGGPLSAALNSGGLTLANPSDVDIDPRPWLGLTNPGINLIVLEYRGGALVRIPIGGGSVLAVNAGLGGNRWQGLEAGPYGSYYVVSPSQRDLFRYDRSPDAWTTVATGGGGPNPLNRPAGVTVDYFTGNAMVADLNAGVSIVPPLSPGPTQLQPESAFPDINVTGIGFSPPLESSAPSANLGVPTRRAPIPGGATNLIGPTAPDSWGDTEHTLQVYIEVTDTGDPLMIYFYDANLRDALDRPRSGGTSTEINLYAPSNNSTPIVSHTIGDNARADLDGRIAALRCDSLPCASATLDVGDFSGITLPAGGEGLYRLEVELLGNNGYNAFGIWVEDHAAYTYKPVYGVHFTDGDYPRLEPLDPLRLYPYVDRGCEFTLSNWDWDADDSNQDGTTANVYTPSGAEQIVVTRSDNSEHAETVVDPSPATPSNIEIDYGAWTYVAQYVLDLSSSVNNYISEVSADFNGWNDANGAAYEMIVPPGNPTNNPDLSLRSSPGPAYNQEAFGSGDNTFIRYYLGRYDETPSPLTPEGLTGSAPPPVPYLVHAASVVDGDPPQVGTPARYLVQVTLENPTPYTITDPEIVAPVPTTASYVDTGTNVSGPATVTGGVNGVVAPCGPTPCSGDITASWDSIAPNSSATLSYVVEVTATVANERLYLTEGPRYRGSPATPVVNSAPPNPKPAMGTSMGTRALFTPAWSGSLSGHAREESLGPLCDLSVLQSATPTPNAVDLAAFDAEAGDGEVLVTWETASEFENLGFYLYRRLAGENDYTLVSDLVLGQGTTDFSARYAVWDRTVPNGVTADYLLEDVEITGVTMLHGPISATPQAGDLPPYLDPILYAVVSEVLPEGGLGGSEGGSPPGGDFENIGSFQVLESDATSILVEVIIPPVTTTEVVIDGETWTEVTAPGYATTLIPGSPELPARSYWVEGLDTTNVGIEVLERDGEQRTLGAPVLPVATAVLEGGASDASRVPDPAAYASEALYPQVEAALAGSVGTGDGERLLAIRIQPARTVSADGVLEIDHRLLLRIELLGPAPVPDTDLDENVRDVAASPGLKIGARGRGLVKVSADELMGQGLDPGADPRMLHLFRNGSEVAVAFEGEADGRLDSGDALLFWAEGIDTRYSDEEIYFLIEGDTPGRRAAPGDDVPGEILAATAVDARGRFEKQSRYIPTILNGEGDNFVGDYVFNQPVSVDVPTPGANGDGATLRVRLLGGTSFDEPTPDHHFRIAIDGVEVMDALFDGTDLFDATVVVPAWLVDGDVTSVEVIPQLDGSQPFLDLVYLDSVDLVYRRFVEMRPGDDGQLVFDAAWDGAYEVDGIAAHDDVRVWNVSDPDAPQVLANLERFEGGMAFEGRAGERYAVIVEGSTHEASSLWPNTPSDWTRAGGADWLAIAHGSLVEAAGELAALREEDGLTTAVVDAEDVFDEVSGGVFTPLAIRDFVRHVVTVWDPAPRYLVFVGDASYDYRDYLHGQAENLVPTMVVDTTFVEAASDSFFGRLDDESRSPGLAIGRVPVRTPAEMSDVVAKLRNYEHAAPAAWNAKLLVVADDGAGDGDAYEAGQFEAILDGFRGELSSELPTTPVILSQIPEATLPDDSDPGEVANEAILDALADGVAVAVYAGHGGPRVWADELIYDTLDAESLDVTGLPFVVALNCLNGFFSAPNEDSLAEVALRTPDRGAIAFLSSTTVTALAGQASFASALAERLGTGNVRVIGDAVLQAQQAIAEVPGAADVLSTWVLIGDPASTLALPVAPESDPGDDVQTLVDRATPLDGTASTSKSGTALQFQWTVVEEPVPGSGVIDAPTSPTPTFRGGAAGLYTLELVVGDGVLTSAPARVQVEVFSEAEVLACAGADSTAQLSGFDAVYLLIPLLARVSRRRARRR